MRPATRSFAAISDPARPLHVEMRSRSLRLIGTVSVAVMVFSTAGCLGGVHSFSGEVYNSTREAHRVAVAVDWHQGKNSKALLNRTLDIDANQTQVKLGVVGTDDGVYLIRASVDGGPIKIGETGWTRHGGPDLFVVGIGRGPTVSIQFAQ